MYIELFAQNDLTLEVGVLKVFELLELVPFIIDFSE